MVNREELHSYGRRKKPTFKPREQMWPAEIQPGFLWTPFCDFPDRKPLFSWVEVHWNSHWKETLLFPEQSEIRTNGKSQRALSTLETLSLPPDLWFYGSVIKEQNPGGDHGVSIPHRTRYDNVGEIMCS